MALAEEVPSVPSCPILVIRLNAKVDLIVVVLSMVVKAEVVAGNSAEAVAEVNKVDIVASKVEAMVIVVIWAITDASTCLSS